MFCPKCGSMVIPKKDGKKTIIECSCGYKKKKAEQMELKEDVKKNIPKDVDVVKESDDALPISDEEICPKCGNKQAYYWLLQTRAGDEAETKFLKCTKCKHIWREYS